MNNKPTVVPLRGAYDASRRDELDQALDRYGDAEPLAFDVRDVERFDTNALRSLIRFQGARREAGKSPVVFLRPSQEIRHFIEVADLSETFECRDEW